MSGGGFGAAALLAALMAADSATAVLERVYGPVTARRLPHSGGKPDPRRHERLRIAPGVDPRYRHVSLQSGSRVLCVAELWYVAHRLPADLLHQLETTDVPFGRVMRRLGLKRLSLESELGGPKDEIAIRLRALLLGAGGLPVAEVAELYPKTAFPAG